MTIEEFKADFPSLQDLESLTASAGVPPNLIPLLQALWHDAKGDWDKAHDIAQDIHTRDGSWLHAYLHRKEGDQWNAGYWYRQAGKPVFNGSLEVEWMELVNYFLGQK